jgi:hypothetical protein
MVVVCEQFVSSQLLTSVVNQEILYYLNFASMHKFETNIFAGVSTSGSNDRSTYQLIMK